MLRQVVVFDAGDLDAESKFWAGIFHGHVFGDDQFHFASAGATPPETLWRRLSPIG